MTDPAPRLGGLTAADLAARFGTPLYVYDADALRATWRAVVACIRYRPSRVHYAAVCNPNLHLLALLRRLGAGLHANTPGDVYCGLRAGYAPDEIVFSGSNLGDEDLDFLASAGVHVNIDSLDDLRRACRVAPGRPLGLRVHLEDVLPESRMGVREHELAEARATVESSGGRVTALHVYCGTHGQDLARYRGALARLVELAAGLPDLDCINLGGGFGYDYHDPEARAFPFATLGEAAEETMRLLSDRAGRPLTLRLEPGRAVIAGAGVLVTRVRSVKAGRGRRYVGTDTTVANFVAPAVHGAHRRVVAAAARPEAAEPTDVCGATTYSRDVIARDVRLPAVEPGELLLVLDAGAYGYCMAGHFLNRPRAAEVIVDGGVARLVTRRESFADLVALQQPLEERS